MWPTVDGKNTFDLAKDSKDDLDLMRRCAEAESEFYWSQPSGERLCAAPFYFLRVAILSKKAGDIAAEVEICEQWKAITKDYKSQPMVKSKEAALTHKGGASESILARLPRAKAALRKQRLPRKAKR